MDRAKENDPIINSKIRIIFVHMIIYLYFQCLHQWSGKWGRDEDKFVVKSLSHFVIFCDQRLTSYLPKKNQNNELVTDRKILWWL